MSHYERLVFWFASAGITIYMKHDPSVVLLYIKTFSMFDETLFVFMSACFFYVDILLFYVSPPIELGCGDIQRLIVDF